MITQQSQVKVNLPIQLKHYLESKAGKFGMPMAGYIKYLILQDVSKQEYPVFLHLKKLKRHINKHKRKKKKEN